jgi:hypothetical protein
MVCEVLKCLCVIMLKVAFAIRVLDVASSVSDFGSKHCIVLNWHVLLLLGLLLT